MLKTRIITAIILAAGLVAVLFGDINNTYWVYGSLFICLLALHEWSGLARLSKNQRYIFLAISAIFGFFAARWLLDITHRLGYTALLGRTSFVFYLTALFWFLCVPIWLKTKIVINNKLIMCLLGVLLIATFWLAFIFAKIINPWCVLSLLATIWIADSAAYFVGKKFGQHKLAPTISPGKTWEGVIGALVGVTIFGFVLFFYANIKTPLLFVGLWIIAALGIIGDLFESLLKRQAGLKDSGHILPGHGGILDRIDGLIPSFPVAIFVIFSFFADSFTR